ncbi:unnamed protein product [Acanthoscelides obtectus]|uniref:Uncharacterized protein n=1 Tax=Acanthoscelides obtectus TaxID=200917 RepID=A0A9P0L8J1_ACAOB|nr:unnamed protein product [Acanthoscelides obtectus]CAK1672454.1 hypothetical protein AOBTE_LOCUS28906 [Acanthoscelides obtectus]
MKILLAISPQSSCAHLLQWLHLAHFSPFLSSENRPVQNKHSASLPPLSSEDKSSNLRLPLDSELELEWEGIRILLDLLALDVEGWFWLIDLLAPDVEG